MNYPVLRNELLTDPLAWGYAAVYGGSLPTTTDVLAGDATVAALLNDSSRGRTIRRADITAAEIWQVLDMADLPALPGNPTSTALSQERRDLAWLTGLGAISVPVRLLTADGSDTQIRANLARLFPAGTGTRTRLLVLAERAVTRADELVLGGVVSALDVARARSGVW